MRLGLDVLRLRCCVLVYAIARFSAEALGHEGFSDHLVDSCDCGVHRHWFVYRAGNKKPLGPLTDNDNGNYKLL
jgi:hypothetical protein